MARIPKGKALTLRPVRLDDDVWAECQRLGKDYGTINEGLRAKFFPEKPEFAYVAARPTMTRSDLDVVGPRISEGRGKATTQTFKGPLLKPSERKK